jgi:hypothetical protein
MNNPNVKTYFDDITLSDISRNSNLALLILFALTFAFTILFHSARLASMLLRRSGGASGSMTLAILVIMKACLLLYDTLSNSLLLYETLASRKLDLFVPSTLTSLCLSVVTPSAIVTLSTNVLVNLPLHYTHLSILVHRARVSGSGRNSQQLSSSRILRAAMRKTFHPTIMAMFGTYAAYSLFASFTVIQSIRVGSASGNGTLTASGATNTTISTGSGILLPDSTFWGWTNGDSTRRRDVLWGVVWTNWVANYLFGVLAGALYWVYHIVIDGFGVRKCIS